MSKKKQSRTNSVSKSPTRKAGGLIKVNACAKAGKKPIKGISVAPPPPSSENENKK